MKKRFHNKFNRPMYEVFAGEYYATKEQKVVLNTLLGSCVSVCMKDKLTGVVGINHIMLSNTVRPEDIIFSNDARYGIHAMELMINDMIKLGAQKRRLEAKVFGGGKVVGNGLNNVAQSNIDFTFTFLKMEGIPVLSKDVGGDKGRKIYFLPDSFTVYLKKIGAGKSYKRAIIEETSYLKKLKKKEDKKGELTLFE